MTKPSAGKDAERRFIRRGWEYKVVQPLGAIVFQSLAKLNKRLPYDLEIPFLHVRLREKKHLFLPDCTQRAEGNWGISNCSV